MNGLSIGYITPQGGRKSAAPGTFHLHEVRLHEVSIVAAPANSATRILDLKSATTTRDFEQFLRSSGLPRAAAAKVARDGWSALGSQDDNQFEQLAEQVKAASLELKGLRP